MQGADAHEAARCQSGYACTGPGCRVHTGKTRRKANHLRPRRNHNEAEAGLTNGPKKPKSSRESSR